MKDCKLTNGIQNSFYEKWGKIINPSFKEEDGFHFEELEYFLTLLKDYENTKNEIFQLKEEINSHTNFHKDYKELYLIKQSKEKKLEDILKVNEITFEFTKKFIKFVKSYLNPSKLSIRIDESENNYHYITISYLGISFVQFEFIVNNSEGFQRFQEGADFLEEMKRYSFVTYNPDISKQKELFKINKLSDLFDLSYKPKNIPIPPLNPKIIEFKKGKRNKKIVEIKEHTKLKLSRLKSSVSFFTETEAPVFKRSKFLRKD